MSFLRNTTRKSKSAVEIEAINRVLNKYVDFKDLYLKSDFRPEAVQLVENCGDACLVLRFDEPLLDENELVDIYTVVHGRFIEFEMKMVSPAGPPHPSYSYVMQIQKCSIALEKREHDRFKFSEKRPAVTNISTIKVREREGDFRKSLSVKMIVEEFINKLEGVDFKRVVFNDEKDIPPPVQYVIESGAPLYLKNLAETDGFFAEQDEFFKGAGAAVLREDLFRWIQNNASNIHSLLVWPITYYPLVGDEFAIGYVMVINKDSQIEEGRIDSVDAFIRDLSEKIRNGNLIESETDGAIIDVSSGGAKIELSDSKLVDKLVSQNVILFEMNYQEKNPLIISGHIVYVYGRKEGGYLVGVDFRGSRFGPKIKNVLPIHIRNFHRQQYGKA
jgi:hypothetical protein